MHGIEKLKGFFREMTKESLEDREKRVRKEFDEAWYQLMKAWPKDHWEMTPLKNGFRFRNKDEPDIVIEPYPVVAFSSAPWDHPWSYVLKLPGKILTGKCNGCSNGSVAAVKGLGQVVEFEDCNREHVDRLCTHLHRLFRQEIRHIARIEECDKEMRNEIKLNTEAADNQDIVKRLSQ